MATTLVTRSAGTAGGLRALLARLAAALSRRRRHGRARQLSLTLAQLDDRTLHDLGFDRSQLRSIGSELHGLADLTLRRAVPAL